MIRCLSSALAVFFASLAFAADAKFQDAGGHQFLEILPAVSPRPGFAAISPVSARIAFTNSLSATRMMENQNLMLGSGVAAADFDSDGLCDLYFCAVEGTNRLYRNLGNWRFEDVTAKAGVGFQGMHSTGALFSDLNSDGRPDLLVATLGDGVHSFINLGGAFRENTAETGLAAQTGSTSLAMADVDGDGDLDLYVANYGAYSILRSGGQAEVKQVGNQWVVLGPHGKRLRYVHGQIAEVGEPDVLYLNDGKGKFKPVPWNSEFFLDEEGKPMNEPWDYGLSVTMRDINGDRFPDIYVCNDFQTPDRIWLNDGKGHFRALPSLSMRRQSFSSMGVDFADVDHDGFFDFFVTEMMSSSHASRMRQIVGMEIFPPVAGRIENRPDVARNTFFQNRRDTTFAEIANFSGVAASEWAWQPVFLDVDLDGFEDLIVANGAAFDVQDRDVLQFVRTLGKQGTADSRTNLLLYPPLLTTNVAFRNHGDFTFRDVSKEWGFNTGAISQGMACADLDNDGDLDLVFNCLNGPPQLLRNESSAPRIALRLKGLKPNEAGIGAMIHVRGGAVPHQMQEMLCGGRYLSGDEGLRSFAAGYATNNLSIEVIWRSGRKSVIPHAKANRIYLVEEPATGSIVNAQADSSTNSLFQDAAHLLNHIHREEAFNDYARQPLLMKQFSQLGPGIGWFDLDGDGHDELVVGAGKGGTLDLYRKNEKGIFARAGVRTPWHGLDDLAGLAAWATHDGSPGFLVALANYESGPTNAPSVLECSVSLRTGSPQINLTEKVPGFTSSPGALAVADIDGDGDLDVFVGGRVVPGKYPQAADSVIALQQNYVLVPDEVNDRILQGMGLVSGAVWSDLDNDGFPELILACEWGPVKIFKNTLGRLTQWDAPVMIGSKTSSLSKLAGWWTAVNTGDFDGDGRMDIVAGNWGLNDAYHASEAHPARLYFGNLAGSGTTDLLESYYAPDLNADVPRRTFTALSQAFPTLLEKYQTHRAFSTATIQEILPLLPGKPESVAATTFASTLFLNRGTSFLAVPLPREAQLAPVFAINIADADGDGHEDLFLGQNFFAMRPEWPRLDGGRGLWLRGDGKGALTPMTGADSGIKVYGEQRGAALGDFDEDGRIDLVVTQNGAATKLFRNSAAKPGLRVRLKGSRQNPSGLGAQLRVQFANHLGPAREIHGGAGYWSQDSLTQVLSLLESAEFIQIRWPGGKSVTAKVPRESKEIEISEDGSVRVVK